MQASISNIWYPITGTKCLLYSAIVSKNWDPASVVTHSQDLVDFKCLSSWHKRDDVIGKADLSGSPYRSPFSYDNAKDGFHCQNNLLSIFHTEGLNLYGDTWFQADLKQLYTLKCIRVSTRSLQIYYDSYFSDVELRFGNKSHNEDFTLNPMIGFSAGMAADKVVEICPNSFVVGQFLILKLNGNRNLCFGEMQITVYWSLKWLINSVVAQ